MAAKNEIRFDIRARDMTRAAFRRVRRSLQGLGRAATSLRGLVAGGLLAAAARSAMNFATAITAASERLDMSSDILQSWKVQAKDVANVEGPELFNVFQRISRNAGTAVRGNMRMVDNFAALGITFKELRELGPDELMLAMARGVERLSNAGMRRQAMSALAAVGDSEANRLIGLLERGPRAFIEETQRLADRGIIQSGRALREQAAAEAKLREGVLRAQTAFAETMVETLPKLVEVLEGLNGTMSAVADLVDKLPGFGPEADERRTALLNNPGAIGRGASAGGAQARTRLNNPELFVLEEIRDDTKKIARASGGTLG